MQLAASQRPHPPPVPPRPSRQVVAEALKRSPRPPCPTRQAPPPPNTKPWRSTEYEAGRTIVYESNKDNDSEPNHREVTSDPDSTLEKDCQSQEPLKSQSGTQETNLAEKDSRDLKFNKAPKFEKERKSEKESTEQDRKEKTPDKQDKEVNIPEKDQEPKIPDKPEKEERNQNDEKLPKIVIESDQKNDTIFNNSLDTPIQKNPPSKIEKNTVDPKQVLSGSKREPNLPEKEEVYIEEESPRPQSRRPSVESLLENEIYELVEECRLKNLEKRDGQDPREIRLGDIQLDPSRPRLRSQKMNLLSRERVRCKNKDEVDGPPIGKSERSLIRGPKPLERVNLVRPPIPVRNNVIPIEERRDLRVREPRTGKSNLHVEETPRPVPPLKPRQRFGSLSPVTNERTGNERNKSISSDDGATVVIVDEPERKVVVFNEDGDNIHHQDWLEAGVRYSSTQITLSGDEASDRVNGFAHLEDEEEFGDLDFSSILERIAMSSLQGLPPLPRSLSGFNLNSGRGETGEPPPPPTRSSSKAQRSAKTPTNVTQSSSRPSPPARQLTTLDTQLAILRREMFGLRQLDLSLLSQLWSLNESIQEFRQLLQEQEDRAPSPSPSSEDGDDNSYPPHPRRPAPTLHHHRPPRPPRPPKPPPSDESPSSEEYGAV